jgi:hypothetical protein
VAPRLLLEVDVRFITADLGGNLGLFQKKMGFFEVRREKSAKTASIFEISGKTHKEPN